MAIFITATIRDDTMKKLNLKYLLLLAGVILLTLHACKKDEEQECCDPTNRECINYDPCHGGPIGKAEFTISNRVQTSDGWQFFPDTMFGPYYPNLYFDALYPDQVETHKWYLGAEVIEEASFVRNFSDAPYPSDITVSHVVTYTELDPCKPDDNGRDSVTVTFRLVESYFEFATTGTFRGSHNGSEEYEWSVYPIDQNGDTAFTVEETVDFRYINFHNTGEVADYFWHQPRNSKVSVYGDGSSDPRGIYTVSATGQVRFDYEYILQGNFFQFTGAKIN